MPDVSTVQVSPLRHELRFVLGRGEVESESEKFCEEIKNKVEVQGFRKGKAPLKIIQQKFADVIRTEVSTRLVHRHTEQTIKERKLKVAGTPALVDQDRATAKKKWLGDFKLDGSFVYAVSIEIEPEQDFDNYSGIDVVVDLPKTDLWVKSRLLKLQNDFAERTQVEAAIKAGDEVSLDYTGSIAGTILPEGSETWRTVIIGSGELPPEFEANIIGHKAGDEVSCTVEFAPDFPAAQIAGKQVDFAIKLHTVAEVRLHPIDDELAIKAVYANKEEMLIELQANAEEECEKPRKAKILEAIITDIMARHPFAVPNSWIDNEMRVVAYRMGMRELPTDLAQLNQLREVAQRSVQQSFILDRIYAKEKQLHITSEELQEILAKEGAKMNKSAAEILGLLKNAGSYEGFVSFHEQQKVVDFLVDSAKIKEENHGSN